MNNNNNNINTAQDGDLQQPFPQEHEIPQKGLLQIALQQRWIILLTTMVVLALAFYYVIKVTPIYTSTSRVYVEQAGPKIITEYQGVMTQSKNYLYTQAEMLKSTPILAGVADDPQISKLKTFTSKRVGPFDNIHGLIGKSKGIITGFLKSQLNAPESQSSEYEFLDNLVVHLKNNLNVSVGKKDDIISVSFDSPYPIEAAQVVNAAVSSYVQYHSSRRKDTAGDVLKILQKEKLKRDKELSDAFEEMLNFTRENGVVSFGDNKQIVGSTVFQRLGKLSDALTSAEMATIEARVVYQAVENIAQEPEKIKQFAMAQPSGGVRVVVDDIETQLRRELKDLKVQLKNAKLHGTKDHPYIQSIQIKVDQVAQLLNNEEKKFADAYLQVVKLKWTSAKLREDELRQSFEVQQKAARSLGVKATEYMVLQSNLARTERLCDILDNRIKEINVTEDVGALNISILEVARPAKSSSKPQKSKTMAMAMILGLMLGGGLALLRDGMDSRMRSADEIAAVLGLSILGVVPKMAGVRKSIVGCGQKVHLKPRSVSAEAYRTIRTAIFYGVPEGKAKTILITSPAPGDGKSTLASNLAITMAQAKQKTIIIDADFRKPMQHKIFKIDNKTGLSNLLAGTIDLDEAIQAGPGEGLDILPCGASIPNPSEMLSSNAFADLLKSLSGQYDRIILDSPPVTPVADSQILGAICDITIVVLRAEKSMRKVSQQTRDTLMSVNAHVLGTVVNDVPRKHSKYGYYSGYGYAHYGYGSKG